MDCFSSRVHRNQHEGLQTNSSEIRQQFRINLHWISSQRSEQVCRFFCISLLMKFQKFAFWKIANKIRLTSLLQIDQFFLNKNVHVLVQFRPYNSTAYWDIIKIE